VVTLKSFAFLSLVVLVAGCGGSDDAREAEPYTGPPIPWAYRAFPEMKAGKGNPSSPAKIELGTLLFYDPILSTDREVACATCHSEVWGMGDGLPVSIGVGGDGPTGPGRKGPNHTRRNAPTLWNVGFKNELFLDGRSPSLEAQAEMPLLEPIELGRPPADVVQELKQIPDYVSAFAEAFPGQAEPVSADNMLRVLAALERTLVSDRAPYDRYVEGDEGALDNDTVAGMFLFAEVGCHGCHTAPLFESARYVARGIQGEVLDEGRFEITGDEADRGAFRVPTLRNARESGPYFHDGSVDELRDAVAWEAGRQAETGAARALDENEIELVTRFIDKALTDKTRDPNRPKTVPSGLTVPVDGFRIPR
jgi:cytochrome c peroxidase